MRLRCVVAALVLGCTAAMAQDIVGKGTVDGKRALLLSDGSWRFDSSVGKICTNIADLVDLCANPKEWALFPGSYSVIGPAIAFRRVPDTFGYVNAFVTGPDPATLTPQQKAKLLLQNKPEGKSLAQLEKDFMAAATRRLGYAPMVITREDAAIAGRDATTFVIAASPAEAITVVVDDDVTVIASTTNPSTLFTDEHRARHAEFLSTISLRVVK